MKKTQRQSGITLIALVITIIVLLILVGIGINMLTGQNGILNRAGEAREKTEMAQIKEEAERVKNDYFMNKYLGDSKLSADNSDKKSVQRYAITNLINKHFEKSTKSGNRVTTADEKYDIIVRNNLDIVVVKHGERYLKVGELEITYYVPEEDKAKKTIELYFEFGELAIKNAHTEPTRGEVPEPAISYDEYVEKYVFKKYEGKSTEDLEEELAKFYGYDTFDKMLTAFGMTKEELEQQATDYNMSYDEFLKMMLSMGSHSDYYVYLAGGEGKTGEELEQFYVDYIGYDGTFEQKLADEGITTEEQLNNAMEAIGVTSKEEYVKGRIGQAYNQKMNEARREIEEKYNQDREEYNRLLSEYQQQFGDIVLTCPNGSRQFVSQADMYAEYVVTLNGTYTFTATGPNGEEGTVTIEVDDIINGTYELDGAMVLLNTTAKDDTINLSSDSISTKNANIATVTNEGIVKCGTETGTTTVTVNGETYKIVSTARIVYTADSTAPIKGTASYNNPVIPAGYSAIDTQDAKWDLNATAQPDVNKGLVIMDEDGNQFVWIPVQTPVSDTEANGTQNKAMAVNVGTTETPKYRGLLYDFANTNGTLSSKVISECTITTIGTREPDVLTDINDGDWSTAYNKGFALIKSLVDGYSSITDTEEIKTKWTNQLQTEYDDMIQNVIEYGGFYIARYESSLINNKTKSVSGSFSMDAGTSSAKTWYGLYQKQKNYTTSSTKGNMIYGSQYDAMLNWMMNNSIDVTSTTPITGSTKNTTRYTGNQTKDKLNNIYDILGNLYEWSQEASSSNTRIVRSGYYYAISNSPSDRYINDPSSTNRNDGSRASLYIK